MPYSKPGYLCSHESEVCLCEIVHCDSPHRDVFSSLFMGNSPSFSVHRLTTRSPLLPSCRFISAPPESKQSRPSSNTAHKLTTRPRECSIVSGGNLDLVSLLIFSVGFEGSFFFFLTRKAFYNVIVFFNNPLFFFYQL